MPKNPSDTALVPIENYAILAENPDNMRAIIADNLGSGTLSPFDLEQIRVPAGGATLWERKSFDDPAADKDGNVQVPSIRGIIIHFRDVRSWWEKDFEGTGAPPDCQSQENIRGVGRYGLNSAGNPTGLCSNCPKSQWKSDRRGGPGQDCSQNRILFMLSPEGLLPMMVKVPPSSFKDARMYNIGWASRGVPVWAVETSLTLTKDKSSTGIVYSKIRFTGIKVATDVRERLRSLHDMMKDAFDNIIIDVSDVRPQPAEASGK